MDTETNRVILQVIEDEMKTSYLSYAMSVIMGRALPDVRDGLKPVHRRILYAMNDMGMQHNKPFKKSARIVGEVLGKYHPHGDSAVYDALVRMAQEFSLRKPLINGQGNFGSIDGDSAAAMRYTEAKLQKIAEELLEDLDKETVEFTDNFDGSLKEPIVLPSKFPNLLVNGSSGIAVGMATNIPPHNITEVCQAVKATIDNPEIELAEIMEHIKAPDLPTGGLICGTHGILEAYKTGKGKFKTRAVTQIEEKGNKKAIIVTELPYQVNKALLIETIANLVKDKKIEGISDLRDESDRKGMRIVIELKQNTNTDVMLNSLYKHSNLETTFGIQFLALEGQQPKLFPLKTIIEKFIEHRFQIVTKRTEYDLKKAEARKHILEGLMTALENSDEVVKLIKKSSSGSEAKTALMNKYSMTELQAQAVLDMKLQKLAALERNSIIEEDKNLGEQIKHYKIILSDNNKIYSIIRDEMDYLIEKYGDERKSLIVDAVDDFDIEDLITPEEVIVSVSKEGYVKRTSLEEYKSQKRGGKGIIGSRTKDEDFTERIFVANTHSYLLLFTESGKVHWLKVYKIPEGGRTSRGRPIVNLIEEQDKITAILPIKEFRDDEYIIMCTKKGVIKKTPSIAYSNPRKGGIIALGLRKNDIMIKAGLVKNQEEILIATKQGQTIRFKQENVRPMGRTATGVRGIQLNKNDQVIGMIIGTENDTILTITENGYGKKTPISDYRLTNRGGKGVINIKTTERNGNVAYILMVENSEGIVIGSREGIIIRTRADQISTIGRNTQGVRLMRLNPSDKVISASKIIEDEIEDSENEQS